jgi:Na+/alanine symporter
MERLASAMTNVMRSNADSNEMITGKAYSMEKFVRINWLWLIFPLLLLVLSLVFLVSTIVKTSKDTETGIWKTSAMPALIYGLPRDLQQGLATSVASKSISERRSKKVRIRLMPKQGWRVSGQVQPASTAPPGFI